MLQTFDITELIPGMYVIKVTKQKGKLKITSSGQVRDVQHISEMVKQGILEVQIDLTKSSHLEEEKHYQLDDEYTNAAGLTYNQQLELSLKLHEQAKGIQGRLIKRVAKGKVVDIEEVEFITKRIVNTAFECDDALSIITLLKEDDNYFLEHSINCALLLVIFGQALRLEKEQLCHLGIGALLMDVGMMKLPLLLTQKANNLTSAETKRMQNHINIALQLIESIKQIGPISMQIIKQHHERVDGSGYPDGLQDKQISLYGKMAAIVDTYDSLTSQRPYRDALSPVAALHKMVNDDLGLDKALVNEFVLCLGTYPIGTLVKLASGKIAMVIRLKRNYPLSPVVMIFYDVNSKDDSVGRLDLSEVDDEIVAVVSLNDINMGVPQLLRKTLA